MFKLWWWFLILFVGLTSTTFALEKGSYQNNLKEGVWTDRDDKTGLLRSQGNYTKGKKNGLWTFYDLKGNKISQGNFKDEQQIGLWRTWYGNGQLRTIGVYDLGEKTGSWTTWYENGKIKLKANMGFAPFHGLNVMEKGWKFWTEEGEPVTYESWLPTNLDVADVDTRETTNCRFFKITTTDNERFEYVQRSTDKNPILFYQHERAIYPVLGNLGRLMLVDDMPADKSSNVYMVDLKTGKKWSIDNDVYTHTNEKLDTNIFLVFANPVGFSPDDHDVLIKMPIGYLMTMGPGENEIIKKYGNPSYVVDSETGEILHEYDQENVPEKWWEY
jgi:hypothetical protein